MTRVLVIEDDSDIALSLKYNLERDGGYAVSVIHDGIAGLREARANPPDLVILDLALPGLDGIELCKRLRSEPGTASIPVIMLTARVEETDRIQGLDTGADDYVTKPFSIKELVARVRAVLRRTQPTDVEDEILRSDNVEVDLAARRVRVGDREVVLTRKEFDLLAHLMKSRGRVVTRNRLLEHVWGYDHPGETRTVDVHVRQLRKKLGEPAGDLVETVVGVGYRFRVPT